MFPGRVPRVRQHDATDCGAACLASIGRFYGIRVPLARIRQYAGTDRGGTSLTGMIRAAARLGFAARGVRAPAEALTAVPLPAVAHLARTNGSTHFVVLYAATDRTVLVMDPADGEVRRLETDEFRRSWSGVLLLLTREVSDVSSSAPSSSAAARFWSIAAPHRRVMANAFLGAIAYTVLTLATAIFVQKIVDEILPAGSRELLHVLTLAMLAIVATQVYLRAVRDVLVLRTGQKLDAALLHGYYQHLLRLPQQFFDTMRVGEIVSRLNDAVKIRAFLNETSLQLLVNVLVVLFSFAMMVAYSWRLAAVVAASIPLYVGIYWATNRVNRRDQRGTMEAAADLEAHLVETIGAASTIRGLGLEDRMGRRGEHRLVRLLRPVYRVGRASTLSGAGAELVSRSATVALLWFGALLVLQQQLTPGELMSFYALNGHLTAPVLGLIAANRQVQDALIAADRLFDVMDLEREREEGVTTLDAVAFDGIHLREVHFRYGSRPPLFRGVSLSIPRGGHTAIVGESGSGKSTLAALIQGQRRPESGRVLFGEVDLRYIRRDSLIQRIAVVPQEVVLFTGTLLDNLVPGETEPDLPKLLRILAELGLSELEAELPAGLRTELGERGYALSGGQRQRVAIARALYRDPEVLILDEATSGLDSPVERRVHAALEKLRAFGKTVVTITHRLGTIAGADHIVVLDRGRVAEEGTHTSLLARSGVYHRLWTGQQGVGPGPDGGDVPRAGRVVPQRWPPILEGPDGV